MTSDAAPAPRAASWPRRILALVVDWFIALLTVSLLTQTPVYGSTQNPLWAVLVFFVETTLLTGLLGFTIGKRLTGIRVVGTDGRPPGLPRAAVRTLMVCLVVPVLVTNPEGRGLHDVAATTAVTPR